LLMAQWERAKNCELCLAAMVVSFRRWCSGSIVLQVTCEEAPSLLAILGRFTLCTWKADDCWRVFTTSRGHVTMAPAVPATLQHKHGQISHF